MFSATKTNTIASCVNVVPTIGIIVLGELNINKSYTPQYSHNFLIQRDLAIETRAYKPLVNSSCDEIDSQLLPQLTDYIKKIFAFSKRKLLSINSKYQCELSTEDFPGRCSLEALQTFSRPQYVFIVLDLTSSRMKGALNMYVAQCRDKKVPVVLIGSYIASKKGSLCIEDNLDFLMKYAKDNPFDVCFGIITNSEDESFVTRLAQTFSPIVIVDFDEKKSNVMRKIDAYIARINEHQTQTHKPDFSYGFWIFAESRAINRETNYNLAIKLRKLIYQNENTPLHEILNDDILSSTLQSCMNETSPNVDQWINSTDIRNILRDMNNSLSILQSESILHYLPKWH